MARSMTPKGSTVSTGNRAADGRLAGTRLDVTPTLPWSRAGADEAARGGRPHLGATHRMERGARALGSRSTNRYGSRAGGGRRATLGPSPNPHRARTDAPGS